jgi:hypothetical protein
MTAPNLSELEPSLVESPALAADPSAFVPGYNRVSGSVDTAVAEEALTTLSTVDVN